MDAQVKRALTDVIATLRSKGFEKYADEIEAAGFEMPRGVGRWTPSMMRSDFGRGEPQEVPVEELSQRNEKESPGLYIALDPVTKKELIVMRGIAETPESFLKRLESGYISAKGVVDELNQAIARGDTTSEKAYQFMLKFLEGQYRERGKPAIPGLPRIELTEAEKRMVSNKGLFVRHLKDVLRGRQVPAPVQKLAFISASLTERGYEALGRRVLEAAEKVMAQ